MSTSLQQLNDAETKALHLFRVIEERGLISAGKTEKQLNTEVYELAKELLGIEKYWHKRVVRAGKNTLLPYEENPQDLLLRENEIIFFDFGPIFENWEADIGKTYVLGDDPHMHRMARDVEEGWKKGKAFFDQHRETITGAQLFEFTQELAASLGWGFGNIHAGHLVGEFPHLEVFTRERINYVHPENHKRMIEPDEQGRERFWIYEIHFIDREREIGGFFEQLLS